MITTILKYLGIRITKTGPSHEARSCLEKVRYGHQETAERAAIIQSDRRALYAYSCKFCDGWHLSSQDWSEHG